MIVLLYKLFEKLRSITPGLVISCLIGSFSLLLGYYFKQIGGIPLAIILGLIIGNLKKTPPFCCSGILFAEKKLLNLAIILLGLEFNLEHLDHLNNGLIFSIFFLVLATILVSILIGKAIKISNSLSLLLGIGNAICGASAIAATSHLITQKKEEIVVAIGVINILGLLGLFILPQVLQYYEPYY